MLFPNSAAWHLSHWRRQRLNLKLPACKVSHWAMWATPAWDRLVLYFTVPYSISFIHWLWSKIPCRLKSNQWNALGTCHSKGRVACLGVSKVWIWPSGFCCPFDSIYTFLFLTWRKQCILGVLFYRSCLWDMHSLHMREIKWVRTTGQMTHGTPQYDLIF